MPTPSTSSAIEVPRSDLGGSLLEFPLAMSLKGFIALEVAPPIEAQLQNGKYGVIPIEQLLQQRVTLRASGGKYPRVTFTFTKQSYSTEEHGLEVVVDDRNAAIYKDFFDAEMIAAALARDGVARNLEIRWAAKLFNAVTWTGSDLTTAVEHEWDDAANAVPITNVKAAMQKVWDNSGQWPDTAIMNMTTRNNLAETAQVIARIHSSGAGSSTLRGDITDAQLALALGLERIIVAGQGKNAAIAGQSLSMSQIWSNEYVMICRLSDGRIETPGIANTIHWGEDGSSIGGMFESYRDASERANVVRQRMDVDEIVKYTEMGHLLSNIVTGG